MVYQAMVNVVAGHLGRCSAALPKTNFGQHVRREKGHLVLPENRRPDSLPWMTANANGLRLRKTLSCRRFESDGLFKTASTTGCLTYFLEEAWVIKRRLPNHCAELLSIWTAT